MIEARSNSGTSDRSESEESLDSFETDSKYFKKLLEGTMVTRRLKEDTQENDQLESQAT